MFLAQEIPPAVLGGSFAIIFMALAFLVTIVRFDRKVSREAFGTIQQELEDTRYECSWDRARFNALLRLARRAGVFIPDVMFSNPPPQGVSWPRLDEGEAP